MPSSLRDLRSRIGSRNIEDNYDLPDVDDQLDAMEGLNEILIQPKEWIRSIKLLSTIFFLFYMVAEVLMRIIESPFDSTRLERVFDIVRPPPISWIPRKRRYRDLQNEKMGPLNGWIKGSILRTPDDFPYDNLKDVSEFFIRGSKIGAHVRLCARIILRDCNKEKTMEGVQRSIAAIRSRADSSDKFMFLYYFFLRYLGALEQVSSESVGLYINVIAEEVLLRPVEYFHIFIHQRLRDENTPGDVYEGSLGIMSLFMKEGASMWKFFNDGGWSNHDRAEKAALTLLMFASVERCATKSSYDIDAPRTKGIERILMASPDLRFLRFRSLTASMGELLFKDRMMWDVTLNGCNDFIEAEWPPWILDRAVWALEYGRKYISEDQLRAIIANRYIPGVDFTKYSTKTLLSFSVSGMVRFRGRNECMYGITANPEAKVVTHGILPRPTIRDLVALGLVRQVTGDAFCVTRMPGSESGYRGVRQDDRLFFETVDVSVPFDASLDDYIG